jgi:hypothetical protein
MTRFRPLPLLLSLVGLAGCLAPGMGSISMNPTIAGGEKVRLDFDGKGQVVPDENEDIRLDPPILRVDAAKKQVLYNFGLTEKNHQAPKKIVVEDVTDDVAVTWAVDAQPDLVKGRWTWATRQFDPTDKIIPWVYQLDGSVRIFQFTITMADGRTLVMHSATNYPAMVKSYYRILLGIDKPPKTT